MGNDQSQSAENAEPKAYQKGQGRLKTVPVYLNVYEAHNEKVFSKQELVGETELTDHEVQDVLRSMEKDYQAKTYDVLSKNCNHFTADFAKRITRGAKTIPAYVNRAASIGSMFKGFLPDQKGAGQNSGSQSSSAAEAPAPSVFQTTKGHTLSGAVVSERKPSGAGAASAKGSPVARSPPSYEIPSALLKAPAHLAELSADAPSLTLQIVVPAGSKQRVTINTSLTVLQLYQHVRALLQQELGKPKVGDFSLVTGFPPKPLLVAAQTAEEAQLRGASVTVNFH